jgi:amino acid permease
MGFVVDTLAMEQVFLRVLLFFLVSIIPLIFYTPAITDAV